MLENKILQICKKVGNEVASKIFHPPQREITFLLNWFLSVFNGVDKERIKLVGPDCTCAEWLLRNGASVRFKGHHDFLSDYNELIQLEETDASQLKVEDIYAKEAGINDLGFEHLRNCKYVKKITLIFCLHLHNGAVYRFNHVKDSLEHVEIRACHNITDKGVKALGNLRNLNTIILYNLSSVKNTDECYDVLKKALPQCKIEFTD